MLSFMNNSNTSVNNWDKDELELSASVIQKSTNGEVLSGQHTNVSHVHGGGNEYSHGGSSILSGADAAARFA